MTQHRRFWYGCVAVGVAGVLLFAVAAFVRQGQTLDAIRDAQMHAEEAQRASEETLSELVDCRQPGGECFHEVKLQHATDLATLILAIGCGPGDGLTSRPERIDYTQRCVSHYIRTHNTIGAPPRR